MKAQSSIILIVFITILVTAFFSVYSMVRSSGIMVKSYYNSQKCGYIADMAYEKAILLGTTSVSLTDYFPVGSENNGKFRIFSYNSGEISIAAYLYDRNNQFITSREVYRNILDTMEVKPSGNIYGGVGSKEVYFVDAYTASGATLPVNPVFSVTSETVNIATIDSETGSFEVTNSPGTGEVWTTYGRFSAYTTFEVQ